MTFLCALSAGFSVLCHLFEVNFNSEWFILSLFFSSSLSEYIQTNIWVGFVCYLRVFLILQIKCNELNILGVCGIIADFYSCLCFNFQKNNTSNTSMTVSWKVWPNLFWIFLLLGPTGGPYIFLK